MQYVDGLHSCTLASLVSMYAHARLGLDPHNFEAGCIAAAKGPMVLGAEAAEIVGKYILVHPLPLDFRSNRFRRFRKESLE